MSFKVMSVRVEDNGTVEIVLKAIGPMPSQVTSRRHTLNQLYAALDSFKTVSLELKEAPQ